MKKKILPLQSLRFIAIVGVFISHLFFLQGYPVVSQWYYSYLQYMYAPVSFFFILSGFVLAYQYHDRFKKIQDIAMFYKKRILQLYPLHSITFFASLPLQYEMTYDPKLPRMIANFFLFHSLVPNSTYYFSFNATSWTLSSFLFCYLLFPLILVAAKILTKIHHAISVVGSIGLWICMCLLAYIYKDHPLAHWIFYVSPLTRFFEITLGCLLYYWWDPIKSLSITSKKEFLVQSLIEIVALGAFPFFLYLALPLPRTVLGGMIFIPYFSFVILIFAHGGGVLSRLLSTSLFVSLGTLSLFFFMTHWLVIGYVMKAINYVLFPPLSIVLFTFFVSLFLSILLKLAFLQSSKLLRKRSY